MSTSVMLAPAWAYFTKKICENPPLWDFEQFLETWKTSKFAIGIESANSADKTQNFAQKMPVLQRREFGDHRSFWESRTAAGFSFRHPSFVCKITFVGKGNCILQRRKTAEKAKIWLLNATKKAVLLKNCFVYLYSKNDNSIDRQNTAEKPPKIPFNGLSFLVFQTKRKLSYYAQLFLFTCLEVIFKSI